MRITHDGRFNINMTNVKTSEKNEIVGEEPGFLVERAEKPPQDPTPVGTLSTLRYSVTTAA
jgi:hypothetical protein